MDEFSQGRFKRKSWAGLWVMNQFYLIKSNFSKVGKKLTLINGTFTLDVKPIIKEINIKLPVKCKIEKFVDNDNEGLKLSIL